MAGFSEPLGLPAAPIQTQTGILGWATYEGQRPAADGLSALTLQAAAEFSATHLEDPHEEISKTLLAAFSDIQTITLPVPTYLAAHRWRYAKVERPCAPHDPVLSVQEGSIIAVAGDWHPAEAEGGRRGTGARAEDAFLSGERAATALMTTLVQ